VPTTTRYKNHTNSLVLALIKDEAIENFARMRENLNNNFRMTRKTGPFVLVVFAIVPAFLVWGSYRYANQIDFAAKRRNESVWRHP
jgi:hypothetical protein